MNLREKFFIIRNFSKSAFLMQQGYLQSSNQYEYSLILCYYKAGLEESLFKIITILFAIILYFLFPLETIAIILHTFL